MKWAVPILLSLSWGCASLGCAAPTGSEARGANGKDRPGRDGDDPAGEAAPAAPTTDTLKAESTLLLVAGVLKWPSDKLASFDPTNRRDKALHELFVGKRGVPEARTKLLLDEQATRAEILSSLRALVAKATPTDTVLFYYAGHGARDEAGKQVYLANYDLDPTRLAETGLSIADVASGFDAAPKGLGVILLGDFCFSGALKIAAAQLAERGLRAASVTSADVSNVSTGSWTYTQTMLDVFGGYALADRDGDGNIELAEAGAEIHDVMKYVERQRSSFVDLKANFILSTATPGPKFGAAGPANLPVGSYAKLAGTDARIVRVRAVEGEVAKVHHLRYADGEELAVPVRTLQRIELKTFAKGSPVRIEWNGTPYPGTVKEVEDDFHLVTYTGFDASWDEWVLSDRILGAAGAPR